MSIRPGGWILMKSAQRRKDEPKAGQGIGMLSISTAVCDFGFGLCSALRLLRFVGGLGLFAADAVLFCVGYF